MESQTGNKKRGGGLAWAKCKTKQKNLPPNGCNFGMHKSIDPEEREKGAVKEEKSGMKEKLKKAAKSSFREGKIAVQTRSVM